ncbi:MAG: exodeoxyribonuclease V subunit alpha [Deltaproteobacteria bacterium]|nr:exodeoxyribonuclease V subunit alpha [Deltaproteobacteria bacterium]
MNKDYITHLYNNGMLDKKDIYFANFIADLSRDNDPEIFLGAALVSSATGKGDICLDLRSVSEKQVMEEENVETPVILPKLDLWIEKLRKSPVVGKPGEFCPLILDENNRIYLYRYWEYEKILSESIKRRINEDVKNIDPSLLKDSLRRLFQKKSGNNIDWQKIASMTAVIKKFCVISGGPGTGKTYTVAKILAILLEQERGEKLRIFLCAPTGKAAAKLSESIKKAKEELNCSDAVKQAIPVQAYTIHRMLQTIPGSPYFRYHSENQIPADVVIVDEASMVDLALMSKLISSIPMTARLILMGDRNQLSSVEAGSVLGDICDRNSMEMFSREYCKIIEEIAGEKLTHGIDTSIKVYEKGQGLYDCIVVLKKSLRFTGKSKIGKLSRAVNKGDWKSISAILINNDGGGIKFEEFRAAGEKYRIIAERIIDGYSAYLKENDPVKALKQFNRFKLLCALKLGPYGAHSLNRLAEEVLKKNKLIKMDLMNEYPWYRGRPVLITKNDYSLGLFNGDMGITMSDPKEGGNHLYVFFPEASGGVKRYSPYRIKEHETAYAMTVHKSQGSEFDHVCLVFPDKDYPVLTRELVYTGITRARKNVLIWGNERVLRAAVSRSIKRTSGLRDALWG